MRAPYHGGPARRRDRRPAGQGYPLPQNSPLCLKTRLREGGLGAKLLKIEDVAVLVSEVRVPRLPHVAAPMSSVPTRTRNASIASRRVALRSCFLAHSIVRQ